MRKEETNKGTKRGRKERSETGGWSVLSDIPKRGIKLDTSLQNKGLQNEKFFYKQKHSQIWGEVILQIVRNFKQRRI